MATNKALKSHEERDRIWRQFKHDLDSGHIGYTKRAKELEDIFLGAGKQWGRDQEIVDALAAEGKPAQEINLVQSSIRMITGYQTQSRMNIAYQPRERGDLKTAEVLTKMALYELDKNRFPWLESEVFEDGLVQQRGYFNIEMSYDNDTNGEISITSLNPMDVIPDTRAKTYDPKDWNKVTVMKWLPISSIKQMYPKSYRQVMLTSSDFDQDWGEDGDTGETRNSFAEPYSHVNYYVDASGEQYVRVLETQSRKVVQRDFYLDAENGEQIAVPDGVNKKVAARKARQQGQEVVTRAVSRIRYHISTEHVTLHDDWSPYDFLTVVPYFPIFRRGITLGLVDNLVSNQEMMNKIISQVAHVVNTTANSGWMTEEDSLANMDDEDLATEGASTGLHIVYKRGRQKPEKIQPNPIPTGLKDIFMTLRDLHDQILGVNEAFRGEKTNEVSGQAIQKRVQQTAVGLTSVIDNLFFSRNILATHMLSLFQNFYTEERIFNIISGDEEGTEQVAVNQEVTEEDGSGEIVTKIVNDVTLGKYDIVISDVPTQVTYLDAQLSQALELKKFGINIPDDEMIRMTTLTRREEIAKRMTGEGNKQAQEAKETQIAQLKAELGKARAEAENKEQDSIKKAAEVAKMIAENPSVAALLEKVLLMGDVDDATGGEAPPAASAQGMPPGLGASPVQGMSTGLGAGMQTQFPA